MLVQYFVSAACIQSGPQDCLPCPTPDTCISLHTASSPAVQSRPPDLLERTVLGISGSRALSCHALHRLPPSRRYVDEDVLARQRVHRFIHRPDSSTLYVQQDGHRYRDVLFDMTVMGNLASEP